MKPGRELDLLVEEKVMGQVWDESRCRICGWGLVEAAEQGCVRGNCCQRPAPKKRADEPGPFSTDISAAWLVVEKLVADGWTYCCEGDSTYADCYFQLKDEETGYVKQQADSDYYAVSKESFPHAICLAALKAVGHAAGEKEEEK